MVIETCGREGCCVEPLTSSNSRGIAQSLSGLKQIALGKLQHLGRSWASNHRTSCVTWPIIHYDEQGTLRFTNPAAIHFKMKVIHWGSISNRSGKHKKAQKQVTHIHCCTSASPTAQIYGFMVGFPMINWCKRKKSGFVSWMGKLCMLVQIENGLLLH